MLTDPLFLTVAGLAVLIAGVSKGGFGGGAVFVATPVLAIATGPVAAAALLLPILIMMDVLALRAYWRQWHWAIVWPMMVACIPGVAFGWLIFGWLSIEWLSILLGVLTLTLFGYRYGMMTAFGHSLAAKASSWGAGIWGAIAGFTSFVIHAGGPPVAIYLLSLKIDKHQFQATTVLFFAFVNAVKLVPYVALGLFNASNLTTSFWLLPLAFPAIWLGLWAHKRISETLYYRAITGFAVLASVKLIWDGYSGLGS